MLESYLRSQLEKKDILLMTHIVVGYPSFEASFKIVEAMVAAGVDLMELQIPFSEPIADGPVILNANQKSLAAGSTVEKCLEFAREATRAFDIPFLFMTYYNILYKFGVTKFVHAIADRGIKGTIIPDLPPEEGEEYLTALQERNLDPIFIFSPGSPQERMQKISAHAGGFVYCVARKGVTGLDTRFSKNLGDYLNRCRQTTDLPLALGFGVKSREDVDFLTGKADIAVIGTETIRLVDGKGIDAIAPFIRSLR
jgi:tryptophan synthase alpha chain